DRWFRKDGVNLMTLSRDGKSMGHSADVGVLVAQSGPPKWITADLSNVSDKLLGVLAIRDAVEKEARELTLATTGNGDKASAVISKVLSVSNKVAKDLMDAWTDEGLLETYDR